MYYPTHARYVKSIKGGKAVFPRPGEMKPKLTLAVNTYVSWPTFTLVTVNTVHTPPVNTGVALTLVRIWNDIIDVLLYPLGLICNNPWQD